MNPLLPNEEYFTVLRNHEEFQCLGAENIGIQLPSHLWIAWGNALRTLKTDRIDDSSNERSVEGLITCIASVLMESSNENPSDARTVTLPRDAWAFTTAVVGHVIAHKQVNPDITKSMDDVSARISLTSIVSWRPIYASIPKLVPSLTTKMPEAQLGDGSAEALLLKDAKHEFKRAVTSFNENYEMALKKYEETYSAMQKLNPNLPNHRELVVNTNVQSDLQPLIERDMPKIRETLAVLSLLESKAAVGVIRQLFPCKCKEYRKMAIRTLGTMRTKHARKALARRATWISGAPKEERNLIRALLAKEA